MKKKTAINIIILVFTIVTLSAPLIVGILLGLLKNSFLSGLHMADEFSEWLLDWMRE